MTMLRNKGLIISVEYLRKIDIALQTMYIIYISITGRSAARLCLLLYTAYIYSTIRNKTASKHIAV